MLQQPPVHLSLLSKHGNKLLQVKTQHCIVLHGTSLLHNIPLVGFLSGITQQPACRDLHFLCCAPLQTQSAESTVVFHTQSTFITSFTRSRLSSNKTFISFSNGDFSGCASARICNFCMCFHIRCRCSSGRDVSTLCGTACCSSSWSCIHTRYSSTPGQARG